MVTKDTGIIEAVQNHPEIMEVFAEYGLGCIGCMAAHFETIGQGAGAHGIDVDALGGDNSEYASFEGHTREQWINDLKTRVSEIQDARRIKNIDAALPLIEKWLSDDDMFALDMEKIEALLGK